MKTPTKMTKNENTDNTRCWLVNILSSQISQILLMEVSHGLNTWKIGLVISHEAVHASIL